MAYRPTERVIEQGISASLILAQLTRRQREVVLLVADGYSHEDAGFELGITRAAVTNRLARAGNLLRARVLLGCRNAM